MINGESSFRILLVDDEEVTHKSIGGFLQDLGYQVLIAENGKQALDILQKENRIGLVISDVKMPVMNGLELLRSIRVNSGFANNPMTHFARTPGPDLNYGSVIIELLLRKYYNRRFCLQRSRARAGHHSIIPSFHHSIIPTFQL